MLAKSYSFAEASSDSGQGDSQFDVIVFGTSSTGDIPAVTVDDVTLDASASETEEGDSESVTSFEDLAHLNADVLLYKASKAKNVAVMLQALAQGAEPNWHYDEEEGRTALIQTIHAVSVDSTHHIVCLYSE